MAQLLHPHCIKNSWTFCCSKQLDILIGSLVELMSLENAPEPNPSFQRNPTAACEVLQDVGHNSHSERTCKPLSPDFSPEDAHLLETRFNLECRSSIVQKEYLLDGTIMFTQPYAPYLFKTLLSAGITLYA
jgi:hypothetical protein